MLSRRHLIVGGPLVFHGLSAEAQVRPQQLFLPYQPSWSIPHRLGKCDDYSELIRSIEQVRRQLWLDQEIVKRFIADHTKYNVDLDKRIRLLEAEVDQLTRRQLILQIALIIETVLLVSSAWVAGPIAVGGIAGLQLIAGTSLLGLQAIYAKERVATLVASYTADRMLFLADVVGQHSGSIGGRLASKALSAVNIFVEVATLQAGKEEELLLRLQLKHLLQEASYIRNLIQRNPPRQLATWQAMYDGMLGGAISSLKNLIELQRDSDCTVPARPPNGPVLRRD